MGLFDDIFGDSSSLPIPHIPVIVPDGPGCYDPVGSLTLPKSKRPKGRSPLMFVLDDVVPSEGSIVCCMLAGVLDHSGVYVGNGRIIHRINEEGGYLAETSPREFLERLDGRNLAVTIFVACKGKNPTGSREIADRAREALNDPQHEGYNLITKNCHQFCHYCLTGKIDNGIDDFTFTALEDEMMRIQDMDTWRRWEFE
ncbi:MAG: hypothetical protein IJG51_06830 [Synergistaceae bacterium]|nr:hypothetical protein [Synergistaceae bacterium]